MQLEVVEGPEIMGGAREWEDRQWFPPGPQLAVCLSGGKQQLADLNDEELLQVAAAARRQTSWAQARELAAIAELTRRRTAVDEARDSDYRTLTAHEAVTEEVAAALTVTGNAAATLVHLAERLTGPLSVTGEALEAGRIDMAKARVICDTTENLPDQVTGRVEAAALEKASTQTTGQLRRRIRRILHRLAPEAMKERKREAARQRRLELWDTPSGTADLALCDLAAEDAHGIYNKITAAAHGLKADGDTRPLQMIRADLATNLLNGAPLPEAAAIVLAQAAESGSTPYTANAPARPPHATAPQPSLGGRPQVPALERPSLTGAEPPMHTATSLQGRQPTEIPSDPIAVIDSAAVSAGDARAAEQRPAFTGPGVSPEGEAISSVARPTSTPVHGRLATIPGPPDVVANVSGSDPPTSDVGDLAAAGGWFARARDDIPPDGRAVVVPHPRASTTATGPAVGAVADGRAVVQSPPAATTRPPTDVSDRDQLVACHLRGQADSVGDARAAMSAPAVVTGSRTSADEDSSPGRPWPIVVTEPVAPSHDGGRSVGRHRPGRDVPSVTRAVECDASVRAMGDVEAAGADGPDGSAAVVVPLGVSAGTRANAQDDEAGLSVSGVVAMIDRRLGHLRDRTPGADLPSAVNLAVRQLARRLASQRDALCQGDAERHGRPGYRPPASMRREVEERHATCVFPTCNRASHRCDLDHTVPWRPGITCRCNLAPLCRRHHRLKQSPGWNLHHVWPGVLVWTTPAGNWYTVRPDHE
ncbi:HNH endonuclease [Actinomadura sp. GC306]|uniref:HNH endonuclease n=1 Tax=Actinomadura sp. GC306 TaxID=2530367 RepID=UPI001404D0A1|nr:HNH endonuclease [Actinomadura sp. GC306]